MSDREIMNAKGFNKNQDPFGDRFESHPASVDWKPSNPKTIIQEGLEINGQKVPDPKLHQTISFIKSGIRILGYAIIPFNLVLAAGVLILSEVIGIVEELV